MIWLFVLSGVVALVVRNGARTPTLSGMSPVFALPANTTFVARDWLLTGLAGVAPLAMVGTLFLYFASAGLFVFGSGLAIVPFLHGGVVLQHHWLTEQQFLDAVAVALITPGPVVITVAFIGYLVAGPLGAFAAAAGVFAPVYFITLLLAPHYERYKSNLRVRDFIAGVTAAATGAITGAVFVLGRRAIVDWTTAAIAIVSLTILLRTKKIPEPLLIVCSGIFGIAARVMIAR